MTDSVVSGTLPAITSQSLTPRDVIANIQQEEVTERSREIKLQEAAKKAEREQQILQKHIYDNANPPALLIVTIGLGIVLTMWIIYMVYLKPNASGEWRDDMNNEYVLTHNRFTGNVRVRMNGKCKGFAKLIDNYFRFGELIGVWDYADNITFINGMQLMRFL